MTTDSDATGGTDTVTANGGATTSTGGPATALGRQVVLNGTTARCLLIEGSPVDVTGPEGALLPHAHPVT